jgi:transposase
MLTEQLKEIIRALHAHNTSIRAISRQLKLSRNTVRRALKQRISNPLPSTRKWQHMNSRLSELFYQTQGNAVRIQQLLQDEGIAIPYSTLTYLLREQDLREPVKRSGSYTYEAGAELQHDTSPHRLNLGDKKVVAQCAGAILPFSRYAFIQYYPQFTRFEAKVFLNDALQFFAGSCARCTIDNTSVIVAQGSGPSAQIAPEMQAFGDFFNMIFIPHAIGHADRKAHVERLFSYVERNFLSARTFSGWADLNEQAKNWCTQVANQKVKRSLGTTPRAFYNHSEKQQLRPLPAYMPPVYKTEHRIVDSYGYVYLDTNRYSVPEKLVGKAVTVLKYATSVRVYFDKKKVAEHPRLIGVKNKKTSLPGHHKSLYYQQKRKKPSHYENSLSGKHPALDQYIEQLKKNAPGRGGAKLKRLVSFNRSYPFSPFIQAIKQAGHYGLFDMNRVEKLILEKIAGSYFNLTDDD